MTSDNTLQREALPFALSDDALTDPVQAIGEVLLHACANEKGYLKPWRPFDIGTVAKWCIAAYEATATAPCSPKNDDFGNQANLSTETEHQAQPAPAAGVVEREGANEALDLGALDDARIAYREAFSDGKDTGVCIRTAIRKYLDTLGLDAQGRPYGTAALPAPSVGGK